MYYPMRLNASCEFVVWPPGNPGDRVDERGLKDSLVCLKGSEQQSGLLTRFAALSAFSHDENPFGVLLWEQRSLADEQVLVHVEQVESLAGRDESRVHPLRQNSFHNSSPPTWTGFLFRRSECEFHRTHSRTLQVHSVQPNHTSFHIFWIECEYLCRVCCRWELQRFIEFKLRIHDWNFGQQRDIFAFQLTCS